MDVSWAKELGIDLEALRAEHPLHPVQLRNHKRIAKRSADFWWSERLWEDRMKPVADVPVVEPVVKPVASVKIPVKRTKVRNYEFTDRQLQIALGVLNAGGAV